MSITRINPEAYYRRFKDLYVEQITVETMAGFTPNKGILLLEVIPECKNPALSSVNKKLAVSHAIKPREPIVFRVISAGEGCSYKTNDLVLLTHLAGDRFAGSDIILCRDEDVFGAWGDGIERDDYEPQKEE